MTIGFILLLTVTLILLCICAWLMREELKTFLALPFLVLFAPVIVLFYVVTSNWWMRNVKQWQLPPEQRWTRIFR